MAEYITVGPDFGKIKAPFRLNLVGSSASGKSTFLLEMLKHKDFLFDVSFDRYILCVCTRVLFICIQNLLLP